MKARKTLCPQLLLLRCASGQLADSVQIFNELSKYRRALEQRNSCMTNLARRYVSGACEDDDVQQRA
ncbi:MAG: hypothetical protein ACE5JX_22120 [Acidobacteriota bacterium]